MNRYSYEGLTKNGDKVSGKLFGVKEDLISEIRERGIILTSIKEDKKALKGGKYSLLDFKVNIEELYHLVSAGIKLDNALSIIIKNTRKQAIHDFWDEVLNQIKGGKQFSVALKDSFKKNNFNGGDLYVNVISVGEEVGDLKNAFKNVLEYLEFKFSLTKEIKSAVSYPLFLLVMSIITVFFVCGFILPKFAKIFTIDELQKLPAISKITISFGKFLNANFSTFAMFSVISLAGIIYLVTSAGFLNKLKKWSYSVPLVKQFLILSDLSNLFSSLGSMLEGGVELSRALKLSSRVVGSQSLISLLDETNEEIRKGNKISRIWSGHDVIPDDVVSLVVVGENSARMGEIFITLGKRYMENFKTGIARGLSLLEPLIIIVLGFFIAFIVVSIMLSVVSLGDVTM